MTPRGLRRQIHFILIEKRNLKKSEETKQSKTRTLKISSDNRGIPEQYGEMIGLTTGDVFDKASLLLYVIEQ